MTVRRVLDMLDLQMDEHRKAIKGHEAFIARLTAARQQIIADAEEAIQKQGRGARFNRKERAHVG